ncbi:MAG: hypothetical protein AAF236_09215, partial [Verrucomicrobiota bacterium]
MRWLIRFLVIGACFGVEAVADELDVNSYAVPRHVFFPDGDTEGQEQISQSERVREVLESAGILFGEGASVFYSSSTGSLVVRNTPEQMWLIEAWIDSIRQSYSTLVYITLREVEMTGELRKRLETVPGSMKPMPDQLSAVALVGIYTGEQFQHLRQELGRHQDFEWTAIPSVVAQSGETSVFEFDDWRSELTPVLGAEKFSIDLAITFPGLDGSEDISTETVSGATQVTVRDGETILLSRLQRGEAPRLLFVTTRLINAGGEPLNPDLQPPMEEIQFRESDAERLASQIENAAELARRGDQFIESENYL